MVAAFSHPTSVRHLRSNPHRSVFRSRCKCGKLGVVVVDHGSRRPEANEMLQSVVDLLKDATGRSNVYPAHMELASPSISEAVRTCASHGAETVVVTPYFLSKGRHIQQDLPRLVHEAGKAVPGVKCILAEPLGMDPGVIEVLDKRIRQAVDANGEDHG